MKIFERTNLMLIIATVLLIAALVRLFTFEKPQIIEKMGAVETLEQLVSEDFLIDLDAVGKNSIFIDIRSQYAFERAHLKDAVHMASSDILNDNHQTLLRDLQANNKTIILYGDSPEEANLTYMMLLQLGYENIKVLAVELGFEENNLRTTPITVEENKYDVKAFIAESIEKAKVVIAPPAKKVTPVKKAVPVVKKKKKRPMEGGC